MSVFLCMNVWHIFDQIVLFVCFTVVMFFFQLLYVSCLWSFLHFMVDHFIAHLFVTMSVEILISKDRILLYWCNKWLQLMENVTEKRKYHKSYCPWKQPGKLKHIQPVHQQPQVVHILLSIPYSCFRQSFENALLLSLYYIFLFVILSFLSFFPFLSAFNLFIML